MRVKSPQCGHLINELIDNEFKRGYKKLTTDFGAEDETKIPPTGISKPRVHKVVLSDLESEKLLISELKKAHSLRGDSFYQRYHSLIF